MKLTRILLSTLSAILLFSSCCYAQQWMNFSIDKSVLCQAVEGQYLWVGTESYLSKINTLSGEVDEFYSYHTVGGGYISSITIDLQGNKWIGTFGGGLLLFREEGIIFIVTDVKDNSSTPESFSLSQNYPNPFNPATTISYTIPKQSFVEMKIFDMLGREIQTLESKQQNAGEYKVQFHASSLPSGVYIYSIQAGEFRDSKKLLLIK